MENIFNRPVGDKNNQFETKVDEAIDQIITSSDGEHVAFGTSIVLKKQFGQLQSTEEVIQAQQLIQDFVASQKYELIPALISSTTNSVILFESDAKAAVPVFMELLDAGDLRIKDTPDNEDVELIDEFLIKTEDYDLSNLSLAEIAIALSISDTIRGFELIRTITERFEHDKVSEAEFVLLGVYSPEDIENLREAEEVIITNEFLQDPQDTEDGFVEDDYVDDGYMGEDDILMNVIREEDGNEPPNTDETAITAVRSLFETIREEQDDSTENDDRDEDIII